MLLLLVNKDYCYGYVWILRCIVVVDIDGQLQASKQGYGLIKVSHVSKSVSKNICTQRKKATVTMCCSPTQTKVSSKVSSTVKVRYLCHICMYTVPKKVTPKFKSV